MTHPDLHFESASVLFSLAALHSAIGTNESRSDKESLKRCINFFQIAAGLLKHIREKVVPQIEHLVPPPVPDLSPAMLEALEQLMLAQAQECFWQQAVMDSLKNATIAKLSMAVSQLYENALAVTERTGPAISMKADDAGKCELPRDWVSHMRIKRHHFRAAAQYRKSVDDMEHNAYGDEIGRLQIADADAKKALDASKRNVSQTIISDLKSLQGVIATNLTRANKDNDLIYLHTVTTEANLPKISPAVMVKSVVPAQVQDPIAFLRTSPAPAYGTPLFQTLVPYGVHLAISVYEDRKETLIRDSFVSRQTELDAIASSTLQSLGLPGSLQAQDKTLPIPTALLRKGEEIRLDGGVTKLHRLIEDVAKISRANATILQEAVSVLDKEQAEDSEVRDNFKNTPWTRPASEEAAHQYRSQVAQYQNTLEQARKSDEIVKQKLSDWEDTIDVLSGGEVSAVADAHATQRSLTIFDHLQRSLESFVPKAGPAGRSGSSAQTVAASKLRAALEELEDIQDSRAAAVAEAKSTSQADDIRPLAMKEAAKISSESSGQTLSVQPSHFEPLFRDQIRKYNSFLSEVTRSESAQEAKLEEIAVSCQRESDGRVELTICITRGSTLPSSNREMSTSPPNAGRRHFRHWTWLSQSIVNCPTTW